MVLISIIMLINANYALRQHVSMDQKFLIDPRNNSGKFHNSTTKCSGDPFFGLKPGHYKASTLPYFTYVRKQANLSLKRFSRTTL